MIISRTASGLTYRAGIKAYLSAPLAAMMLGGIVFVQVGTIIKMKIAVLTVEMLRTLNVVLLQPTG